MAHLLVIDTANLVRRAFYVCFPSPEVQNNLPPDFDRTLAGRVAEMTQGLIRKLAPTHLVFALDVEGVTFRKELFEGYKSNRDHRPGPSTQQLLQAVAPYFEAWGVATAGATGFEADDVMGTLAMRAAAAGSTCTVLSKDGDMWQLASEQIRVLKPMKGGGYLHMDEEQIRMAIGVSSSQVADFKALAGDRSDSIPGIVGKVKSAKLLSNFKDIDGIYRYLHLQKPKDREVLVQGKEKVFFFRDLIRLRTDISLDIDARATSVKGIDVRSPTAVRR